MKKMLLASFFILSSSLVWARERPKDFKFEIYAVGERGQLQRGFLGRVELQVMPRLITGGRAYQSRGLPGSVSEYTGYGLINIPGPSLLKNLSGGAGLVEFSYNRHEFYSQTLDGNSGQVDTEKNSRAWGPVLKLDFNRAVGRVMLYAGFNYYPHLFRADRLEQVSITNFGHRVFHQKEAGSLSGYEMGAVMMVVLFKRGQIRSGLSGGWQWRNLHALPRPFSFVPDYGREKTVLLGWGLRF